MSIHDRIREARTAKGWTQKQLGDALGVAGNTVTGYEKNREPTAAQIGEIADALGVDANYLLQDELSNDADDGLSLEEQNIIKKYRALDQRGKDTILAAIDRENEYARQSAESKADKQIRGTA